MRALVPFLCACLAWSNAQAQLGLSVQVLDCGTLVSRNVSMFNSNIETGTEKVLANSCYLVRHPEGTLLWDTGMTDELAKLPDGKEMWDGAFHVSMTKTLLGQLQEQGVSPEQIDYLALSHLHSDHTGNANAFAKSTWLVQRSEHKVSTGKKARQYGFKQGDYNRLRKVKKLNGDHDVFGDGSVVIVRTPGHTPGHQSLLLKLEQHGPVVLSGDLYHFQRNHDERAVPSFNADAGDTRASFDKLDELIKETGAELWIQHDKPQFDRLMAGGTGEQPGLYF
ncbi:hypothetical protein GCM10011297_20310 [Bacterioplanes sanyensis]|uniref:N-acyl homoserine lactonase family protein n=1 Tax=Bacterioplanes sanyensis TaxID=1249553 RepID=UPI00167AA10A|nr:N-acyl homoserine lactonase family protein [Bacterioplanes sanyensis]GGY47472.1 hypothetical protein GCM10011297_20310 [Bacterioplanes sanyensis]